MLTIILEIIRIASFICHWQIVSCLPNSKKRNTFVCCAAKRSKHLTKMFQKYCSNLQLFETIFENLFMLPICIGVSQGILNTVLVFLSLCILYTRGWHRTGLLAGLCVEAKD